MDIENNIFKKHTADFKKLENYGFKRLKEGFELDKTFKDGLFRASILVNFDGKVSGKVFDLESNDEFLPLRVEHNVGAFIGEIRTEYEKILTDIRENCFTKEYFVLPQSNRIVNLLIEKYGDMPEFLWEKFTGTGVFRNSKTKKWYLAILNVDRSKIEPKQKGLVEVADIKLAPESIQKLLKQKGFYPGYHMNKKYWLTIVLDDTVSDEKIMELIEESYGYSQK